jgi:hypothetical protein
MAQRGIMATIRKRGHKWQVQVRRNGLFVSKSFHTQKDAQEWARQMEVQADRRDLPPDPKALERVTLGELVQRYRDTVTAKKRGCQSRLSSLIGSYAIQYALGIIVPIRRSKPGSSDGTDTRNHNCRTRCSNGAGSAPCLF